MKLIMRKTIALICSVAILIISTSAHNDNLSIMTTAIPTNISSDFEDTQNSLEINVLPGESVNLVSVRVLLDNAYQSFYGANCVSQAESDLSYVELPFYSTWGIDMSYSYAYVSPTLQDGCTQAYTAPCTSTCGTNGQCISTSYPSIHHKNYNKCLNSFSQGVSYAGYDLMLMLTAIPFCGYDTDEGGHYAGYYTNAGYTGVVAVAQRYGKYTIATMLQPELTLRFRTIQHELSHNFGCDDGVCSPGELCIMRGSFDNTSILYFTDIWCTNCKSMFNSVQH